MTSSIILPVDTFVTIFNQRCSNVQVTSDLCNTESSSVSGTLSVLTKTNRNDAGTMRWQLSGDQMPGWQRAAVDIPDARLLYEVMVKKKYLYMLVHCYNQKILRWCAVKHPIYLSIYLLYMLVEVLSLVTNVMPFICTVFTGRCGRRHKSEIPWRHCHRWL